MKTCADLDLPTFDQWAWFQLNKPSIRMAVIRAWIDKYGRDCLFCGVTMKTYPRNPHDIARATIDHIDARSLGGQETPDNFQVICLGCNGEKSRAESWAVRYFNLCEKKSGGASGDTSALTKTQ